MASQNWVSLFNPDSIFASGPGTSFTMAASGNAVLSPVTGVSNQDVVQVNASGQYLGWKVGLLIRYTARGFITTTTTTGTLTFLISTNKGNATAPGSQVAILSSVGITTPATVVTGMQWEARGLIRCTAIATSGNTIAAQGEINIGVISQATPALPSNPQAMTGTPPGIFLAMPNASGETATAVDTTQIQGINLRVTSTAAQGTIQCTQWFVEAMN